jgi:hypothetical protein
VVINALLLLCETINDPVIEVICAELDTVPAGSCAELLHRVGTLVKLEYGNVPTNDPVNDPVNGLVSELNCVELDIVPAGNCAELDTVPDGNCAELDIIPDGNCAELDTVPAGSCAELLHNVGTLVNPENGRVPANDPVNDPVKGLVSELN